MLFPTAQQVNLPACSVMGTINLSTKAITKIDNFRNALGDIDKSQFLKAISVSDKLSPINFSNKCCGKFLMCLTKIFSCESTHKSVFLDFSKK